MSFDVWSVLNEETLLTMRRHVLATPQAEVGGFVLGVHGEDDEPPQGIVAIEAYAARGDLTRLTFTHEAWEHVHRIQDERYPDTAIIGWYHSHPGHGIFLSGHDKFIQRHFFGAPWQIAIVLDPIARTEGMFAWARGEIIPIAERSMDATDEPGSWDGATAFTLGEEARPAPSRQLVVGFDEAPSRLPPGEPAAPPTATERAQPGAGRSPAPPRRPAFAPALLWAGAGLAIVLVLILLVLR
jgi:proteasome lid subunit RPN8/RPN11